MTDDLKTLLTDLVDDQPQPGIDLDRQIARGRRRVRRRNLAAGTATAALVAGLVGVVTVVQPGLGGPTLEPSGQLPSASSSTALRHDELPTPGGLSRSTEKSRALAAELERLAPEIAATAGARRSNAGWDVPDAQLHAEALWVHPAGDRADMVHIVVDVGASAPVVCIGLDAPAGQRCGEVRRLGDGSTAYIHSYTANGGQQHEVRLQRPDGTRVTVSTGAQAVPGSDHQTPLTADRVLEIAQGITVTP